MTVNYTPNGDYSGPDSFTFKTNDGDKDSTTATVSITVNAVNDAPIAVSQTVTTNEDTATAVTLSATDVDSPTLTYALGSPSHGTLSGTAPNLTYTPGTDFNGNDSFIFTANDGTLTSNVATVSITVNAANDAPVAHADSVTTNEDSAVTFAVLANDTDVDGDSLAVTGATNGAHGTTTANADNTISYTPGANYFGPDTFTYTVSDGHGGTATGTVTVTVQSVNDAPVVNANSASD